MIGVSLLRRRDRRRFSSDSRREGNGELLQCPSIVSELAEGSGVFLAFFQMMEAKF